MSSHPEVSTTSSGLNFDDDNSSFFDLEVVELQQSSTESGHDSYRNKCLMIAAALHENGAVIIKDDRVSVTDNDAFIDMMERFVCVDLSNELIDLVNNLNCKRTCSLLIRYYAGSDGIRDARPEYHYQVGVTPSRVGSCRNINATS